MSARDELAYAAGALTPARKVQELLDAYRAEVLAEHRAAFTMHDARGIARNHRTAVLREAARLLEGSGYDDDAVNFLDRMADEK